MLQAIHKSMGRESFTDIRLYELLSSGFILMDDCYVLKKFYEGNKHIKASDFVDRTGYESFINSFHIDDYIEDDFLNQSIFCAKLLFEEWKKLSTNVSLEVIIIETDFGFNIKFHSIRDNEIWINEDDLDKFSESIMICRSTSP